MYFAIVLVLALHAMSGVFWAGSTFVLARGAVPPHQLRRPQAGATAAAVLTGAILWVLLHRGSFGTRELALAAGACAALLAALVQFVSARGMPRSAAPEEPQRARALAGQRIAAGLLALTVLAMVLSRWV